MINSKRKGARGEREYAVLCREQGYENVRRGQQYHGLEGDDIVGLEGVHVEVKRVQKLNIDKAMDQSKKDATAEEIPTVAHRKNNAEWLTTMLTTDWFKFYDAWLLTRELDDDAEEARDE
jgi:Holliday junction resolvase